MEQKTLKILVADDHSIVRDGLIQSLTRAFPEVEIGEADQYIEIFKLINQSKWDLVILDVNLPGKNGIEILKEIKGNYPDTRVIIFSMYPEDQFAVRAIKAGASAYLTKEMNSAEIIEAVRKILKGERYLTQVQTDLIANELFGNTHERGHEILSDREYQVFLLIASGKNLTSIAEELNLSIKTISVYRGNIIKKMNLKNNAEIIHYAFKHQLIL